MSRRDRGRPTVPEGMDVRSILSSGGGEEKPVLVVLTGPQVGQRILLEQPAVVGRDPEADLMLYDESVAWHHARVEPRSGGWAVVDLTGEQRTEINGMRVDSHPLEADDQLIIGHTVVRFEVHDPIEQAYDEAVLERLYKDDLTGLLSRRRFDIELSSAVSAAQNQNVPLTLIVLDVDRLKPINDRHGHLVGSMVISQVGRLVGEVVGSAGAACRLGGDEFGVALLGVDRARGEEIANRVRRHVATSHIAHEGVRLMVRVSAGVASFPSDGATPLELLRWADRLLYLAKGEGGDRVHSHPRPRADPPETK